MGCHRGVASPRKRQAAMDRFLLVRTHRLHDVQVRYRVDVLKGAASRLGATGHEALTLVASALVRSRTGRRVTASIRLVHPYVIF